MRVTVTELKKMIAESVAKQMKEDADIHALATRTPSSAPGETFAMPRTSRVPPPPASSAPAPARSSTATVRELRSMVREVIEEMMGHEVEKEMNEVEELKEAVKKMVRAELKRSGK